MRPNLSMANMKKLRQMVLKRQKSPTAKINSILKRKARFARLNPKEAKKHSHELIFAQSPELVRTTNGEKKKRTIKFKYGAAQEATSTSVGLSSKFVSTRRLLHTHPLVVVGKKTHQVLTPSLSDLIIFLNMNNTKSTLIAVPSKRSSSTVAGYMVVRKTQKSAPLTERIKQNQKRFMMDSIQNSENFNYWTNLLKTLESGKYTKLMENKNLTNALRRITSKVGEIQKIREQSESIQKGFDERISELRQRYHYQQMDQITFEKETAKLREEKERIRVEDASKRIQAKAEVSRMLTDNGSNLMLIQTYQFLLDKGFIDKFSKSNVTPPVIEYKGFQKIKATPKKGIKLFTNEENRRRIIEKELGLQLRLVPAKGFKLQNGQFVKEIKK